jgi:hypothetical protein
MSPRIVTVRHDDLEARRNQILDKFGMTLDELKALAVTRTLTGEELEAIEELREIEFLLGEHAVAL